MMPAPGDDHETRTEGAGGPQNPEVLLTPPEIAADRAGFTVEAAETATRDLGDGRRAIDSVVLARRSRP
jgi:hypothetical protein